MAFSLLTPAFVAQLWAHVKLQRVNHRTDPLFALKSKTSEPPGQVSLIHLFLEGSCSDVLIEWVLLMYPFFFFQVKAMTLEMFYVILNSKSWN